MRGLFTFCYSDEQMQKLEALGIEITYLPEESLTVGTSVAGYDFWYASTLLTDWISLIVS